MRKIKIGVLGGIGPEATGMFYLKLIKKFQNSGFVNSNKDFPQIVINSIPAPELVFNDIKRSDIEPYIAGLKELDSMNPDFIIIVCNTAHIFYDEMQSNVKAEIIDLRNLVFEKIRNDGIKKVTLLGTPCTVSALYKFDGINYMNPNEEELELLSNAIFLFNRGVEKEKQLEKTIGIVNKKLSAGSQSIILACTEFAVMLADADLPKTDTIELLADEVVRRCLT